MNKSGSRQRLLDAGANRFASEPFASIAFDDIARDAAVHPGTARTVFAGTLEIAGAILDHERASMRRTIAAIETQKVSPLQKIIRAFEAVGRSWSDDMLVRAGVRLAAESRHHFPDRRLDPFETWRGFIAGQLHRAWDIGSLREVNIEDAARVVVAIGLGTKDIITLQDSWPTAEMQMSVAAHTVIRLIAAPGTEAESGRQ